MSGSSTGLSPYCELHAHSHYSLLDGVPSPEQLIDRAVELGLPALALTDHDAVYGLVPFVQRAKEAGIKPILGAELTFADGAHLTLLAETNEGYANLCKLISIGRANAPKGESYLPWAQLPQYTKGLLCLTGCREGPLARHALINDLPAARRELSHLIDIFGRKNIYIELQRHIRRGDFRLNLRLQGLAVQRGLPIVATGNVHYLSPEDADLQSALVSIRHNLPVTKAGDRLRPNREYFMRSAQGMATLFFDLPQALRNTVEIAERCNASLPMGLQVLPKVPMPIGVLPDEYLRTVCRPELQRLYPHNTTQALELLEKELALIKQLQLANYFLIVWDIVAFCQRNQILCHGRGSAANSIVARLLGISAVDPIAQELVIERFLSVEHGGTPDIDLDIDAMRREEVIQYVYNKYGRDHAAMACTYVTYRSASSIRDAGLALGFKAAIIDQIADAIEDERKGRELDQDGRVVHVSTSVAELAASKLSMKEWQQIVSLANRLQGRPRHLGIHNGGMIITEPPITRLVPVEPATMADRTVVQFDKEWLETLGIVKIDLLGLRMLSAIADTVKLVKEHRHKEIDLYQLDFKDRRVYDRICASDTIGMFQLESGAQASVIPKMQPRCFQDIVIEVSLIRPGPLQGGMVKPYIRRRQRLEAVTYLHDSLKPALRETLGVVVFQEQVIKVACDVAGFAPGRGELLRRALGNKNAADAIEKFRLEFLDGAQARGVPRKTANEIWTAIAGFAGYSFSKAHAAAFAVIVYWSAWLRTFYTTEYFCGLLRNSPLGTYSPRVLEAEARRHNVKFRRFDVNRSMAKATVEEGEIRHGLSYVKHIGDKLADEIVAARGHQPFTSLVDFIRRTGFARQPMESLIRAGAFDYFGDRRRLWWDLAEAFEIVERPPMLPLEFPDEKVALKPMTEEERLVATFAATGVSVDQHLVEVRRDAFTKAGCVALGKLRNLSVGTRVRVGGLVADGVRRPPTAKGTAFIRLEQPNGIIDVVIPKEVYLEYRKELFSAFVIVEGILKQRGRMVSVTAKKVRAM